jgi:antitoxin component of MazEF toxin-antitoxin module
MTFYRIKENKLHHYGSHSVAITLPDVILKDLQVEEGETLSLYSGVIGGVPVMVLANLDAPELTDQAEAGE